MNIEILVHVTAPGRVADDRRYRAIAEGIITFESVNIVSISNNELEASNCHGGTAESPNSHGQFNLAASDADLASHKPWGSRPSRRTNVVKDVELIQEHTVTSNSARLATSLQEISTVDDRPPYNDDHIQHHNSWLYRSPGDDSHVHKRRRLLEEDTKIQRPNTAPEPSSATVLVPLTERKCVQRASSEPLSPDDGLTAVSNSQPSSAVEILGKSMDALAPTLHDCPPRNHHSERSASGIVSRSAICGPSINQSEGSYLETSMSVQLETRAAPDSLNSFANDTNLNSKSFHIDADPSSLTSPVLQHVPSCMCMKEDLSQHTARMQALPWKTDSPGQMHTQSTFTSAITTRLQEIEETSRIEQWFWPIRVTRDVGVLERGYWKIPITIAYTKDVETWRSLWTGLKHGPLMDKFPYSPWSAEEYFAFFDKMNHSIETDQLGSVSLYIVQSVTVPDKVVPETIQVELRLYGWGEVCAHLYMAMRWASEGRIAHLPLVWIGCDGTAVVTMSGERYCWKIPKLGGWVRKGREGALGMYGIV